MYIHQNFPALSYISKSSYDRVHVTCHKTEESGELQLQFSWEVLVTLQKSEGWGCAKHGLPHPTLPVSTTLRNLGGLVSSP